MDRACSCSLGDFPLAMTVASPVTVMMAVPAPAMMMVTSPVPAVMVMTMPAPAHFGGHLLFRVLLYRSRRAGIDQRSRLRVLHRSRQDEKRAGHRKTQNFRSVHPVLLHII